MKKIMIFLMTIFTCALFIPRASAKAVSGPYVVYDDISNYPETRFCEPNIPMNVLKGMSVDNVRSNDLYQELIYLNESLESGDIIGTAKFQYAKETFNIQFVFTYTSKYITRATYSLDGTIFYDVSFSGNDSSTPTVVKNDEIHFFDKFSSFSSESHFVRASINIDNVKFCYSYDQTCIEDECFEEIGMMLLRGGLVKYNTVYDGKECHVVTEHLNRRPLSELLSGIKISDLSEQTISDYQIIKTDYDEETSEIGVYNARILARDKAGNCVVQDVKINVVDAIGPELTIKELTYSYARPKTAEEIKEKIVALDDGESASIELQCDEYLSNSGTCGRYPYTVIATDRYGNKTTKSSYINVIDDIAPIIRVTQITIDAPYEKLSLDKIREKISVIDAVEGVITGERIALEDLNHYMDNHDKLGSYRFNITVSDNIGNKAESSIYIYVVDKNYPTIEFENGVIVINQGDELTKDLILNMLRQTGQITSESIVSLRSAYFEVENPLGEYDIEIELSDGRVIKDVINVLKKQEIDYNEPEKKPKNKNNAALIGTVVTLFSAALAGIAFILIKKKH